ncbi:hypothetical protein [Staphylococcus aureus]|nr:hypothetical protein [Staphylococcus aureus]
MEFKKQFPDYLNYKNEEYLMNVVTEELLREIAQRLPRVYIQQKQQNRYLNLDETIKNACDVVSIYTNNKNRGYDFIIRDFEEQVVDFKKIGKFHKFMDATSELAKNDNVFEDYNFGYKLTNESKYNWLCINPNVGEVVNFEELIITTSELCKQTAEHIKQAQEQLNRVNELRARKDAIRDCLSAMEALMTYLTGTTDISAADKAMRDDEETWGQGFIIKEGITMWNMFHNKYKDIRHGNNFDISLIS